MGDQVILCETLCRQFPAWVIELVVLALLAAQALRSGWKNRKLATDNAALSAQVKTLSLRPPPAVQIQLAPNPGMASLVPIAMSTAPADQGFSGKNSAADASDSPEPSDPDHAEPTEDGP